MQTLNSRSVKPDSHQRCWDVPLAVLLTIAALDPECPGSRLETQLGS